jgi:hypothetical protein
MVSIIGAPPPLGISGPGGISTTRVIFLYHETSPPAGTENVQVSEKLPVPCVILHWECFQDTAAAGIINWTMSLYVSNNDSLSTNAAALGTRITSHRDAGSSPPDIDVARAGDLAFPFVGSYVRLPLWIPVYESPSYIKTLGWQVAAANMAFTNVFVIGLLESGAQSPGAGIIPRGTPEEPACVRICGWDPGVIPPGPPPPPPPPPPEPGPAPGPPFDPLQHPLPTMCPINPEQPLQSASQLCEVP